MKNGISKKSDVTSKNQKTREQGLWRAAVDSVLISDNHWWCIVTMMVEATVEHSRYISLFDEVAEKHGRTHIYPLSYQKAIVMVKMLSRQDPEKCPVIQGICHYANVALSENKNGDLSTWLMARIIKYLIYRAKIEHVGRLKLLADSDRENDGEYRTTRNIDGSTASRSTIRPGRADSSEAEYTFSGKAGTRSLKRDEEWRDVVHADDAPFDGPSLYVVLSGFHDPDLPAELLSVGVPLTCILKIKLPDEQYVVHGEMMEEEKEKEEEEEDSTFRKKEHLPEDYRIGESELFKFWTITRERLANPSAYPAYSDVAMLTFRPSVLSEPFGPAEKESFAKDMYDRVLLTLYHLYDLCRQHEDYLKSMRLEKAIVDARSETTGTNIYEDVLSDIPNEYINVPLILCAMLLQVESDLARSSDKCHPVDRDTEISDSDARHENTSRTTERASSTCSVRDKLALLDLKHELRDEYAESAASPSSPPSLDLKLISYGDTLGEIVCRFLHRESVNLVDAVLPILRDSRIISIWRDHEALTGTKAEMYRCHIDNIARTYSGERTIGREEAAHYLHLLMFDKLIFSKRSEHAEGTRSIGPLKDELSELKYARSAIKRTHSASNLTSALINTSSLRRSRSDTEIDYGKPLVAFTDCPFLFALTDTRETLLPGYLYRNVYGERSYERPSIDEYEDVELLSDRVFPQIVYECFQSFDRFAARYFEPTDSVLLYFSNNNDADTVSERTCLSSIPTPVRFREFCKYIAREEEEDWIKREREARQSRRIDLTGRFMKKSVQMEDDAIIFDDKCFVLPDSLKARHLRKSQDRDTREKISETMKSEEATGEEDIKGTKMTKRKRDGTPMMRNVNKQTDGRVMNGKTSMAEKKSDSKIDDIDTSFLPVKKIPSLRCAGEGEPYDLIGYDLGDLRVQVNHRSKKFLLRDDISVLVEYEDWLHGDSYLRIAVILRDCTLRLSSGVSHQSVDTFHLTTKRGTLLSFCRNRKLARNLSDCDWRNSAFDFRASWPSGLLIEPTIGDGTKNPFCIRQSYVSKRPERAGAAREVCRNFLRNGTVLKHLDDNTVVIFRPNGVIVTCTDFDKPQSHDESAHRTVVKKLRVRKGDSKQSMVSRSEEKVVDSTLAGESIANIQPSKQDVLAAEGRLTSNGDDLLITEVFATGKVLRYEVVNYDGRHYEVLNDLVVSECDRLLVRTASDYEVDEIFTRRADGTDMLLRSNGELMVTFADGTRITTGYKIEEQLIMCDWSDDELQWHFGSMKTNECSHGSSELSSNSNFLHEDSSVSHSHYQEKLTRPSIADGFVSILLTFRMEHKDYATVSYDQSAVRFTLSMPDDLRVSISGRGHYEVSMGEEVNLEIRENEVEFSKICTTCGGRTMSTYEFCESSEVGSRTIFITIDILGNVLEVKSDGTTRYYRDDRRYGREGYERNSDVLERSEERRNSREEGANSLERFNCKHQQYCEKLKFPARSQYRIFVMNRDLTVCEYLHRSVRREQEVAAVFDDGTNMIQYPISRRSELRRLITFVPVEPELGSKEISYQYRVKSDKRTDYTRIELQRSTYSFPYNWLFPFSRRDQEVSKSTQNEVSVKQNEQLLPKLLRVRVLFGIKEAGKNVLIDMQRAMGHYWISVFRDGDKCRLFHATGSSRLYEVENDYKSSEDGLRDLALGIKESIDVQTYIRSLRGKLIKASTKASRQPSRLAELIRQRDSIKEKYRWYKQCMRKRIIVPYFQNVVDSCYLLIEDLVDEAMRISKKSDIAEKGDELIDSN